MSVRTPEDRHLYLRERVAPNGYRKYDLVCFFPRARSPVSTRRDIGLAEEIVTPLSILIADVSLRVSHSEILADRENCVSSS